MSKHPTERVRSIPEMQATSMQQSEKALRRMAAAEERLARLEGRLAEKDEMLSEFQQAYGRQADTITALTAVVRELESKLGKGVDQVLTGLESRLGKVEWIAEVKPLSRPQVRVEAVDAVRHSDLGDRVEELDRRIKALENPPLRRRGRPKGSKNKPKDPPAVDETKAETAETAPTDPPEVEKP